MPVRHPTKADVEDLAADLDMSLGEDEATDLHALVEGVLEQFRTVNDLPDPDTPASLRQFETRRVGSRPSPSEDPYNVWITTCRVDGADTGHLANREVGLKDTIAVAGVEQTCGSNLLEGYVPDIDATVTTRLLEAGATIVGKTNMESFAFSSSSDLSDFGTVLNPRNTEYMASGSSSGTAAAVAAGEIDIGIGCDQAGSIRMPAASCGVVGLKPTTGLVPYTGIFPIEPTVDHVGPMTTSVADAADVLDVIAGGDGLDPRQPADLDAHTGSYTDIDGNCAGRTVAVLREGFEQEERNDAYSEEARHAVDRLESEGADVIEVSIPDHFHAPTLWTVAGGYGMMQVLAHGGTGTLQDGWYDTQRMTVFDKMRDARASEFPPTVKGVLLAAKFIEQEYGSSLYGKAKNLIRELRSQYDEVLQEADAIVMPTVPREPFKVDHGLSIVEHVARSAPAPLGTNTCPFNLTSHPALTVPCGAVDDLPVGLMFVGDHFDEAVLFELGQALEETREGQAAWM